MSQAPLAGIARKFAFVESGGARELDVRAEGIAGEGVSAIAPFEEFGEVVEARISFSWTRRRTARWRPLVLPS